MSTDLERLEERLEAQARELEAARLELKAGQAALREELTATVAAVGETLELRGAPQGVWLLEIDQVRASLAAADELLRRMRCAILAQAEKSPLAALLGAGCVAGVSGLGLWDALYAGAALAA